MSGRPAAVSVCTHDPASKGRTRVSPIPAAMSSPANRPIFLLRQFSILTVSTLKFLDQGEEEGEGASECLEE